MISFSGAANKHIPISSSHLEVPGNASSVYVTINLYLCVHWLYQTSFQAPISQYIMS